MMKGIAQDFVKYVMHVQVVRNDAPAPVVQNVQQSSSDDATVSGFATAANAAAAAGEIAPELAASAPAAPTKQQTIVKDEWSKTPRNAACPCGSGKKFKQCHGATL
jgi:preprotein translocase subunit SecA